MKPRDPAWLPVDYDLITVDAVKAMSRGEATADQQGRVLKWIIETVCETYTLPFRSDADGGERETSFALGRVFAGQQIVKLVNMPPSVVAALRKKNG